MSHNIFSKIDLIIIIILLAKFILEDGYTVSTIVDGDKQHINPRLILPQFGSTDFIILDSSRSTLYTLSFPSPKESVIKKLVGNGAAGYADGELGSAMFHQPRNFAIDYNGNIYVADRSNHVIRKISKSGVTTIAGGNSRVTGKTDGLAQNATFSDDLQLTFAPERCALVICDRGNRLIRQINLKTEDCPRGSHSGLGMPTAWALGIGLFCLLLGVVVGFVSHPYVISCGGMRLLPWNGTWKDYLTSLVKRVLMLCFDIRSVVVNLPLCMLLKRLIQLSLSNLSLMFRITTVEYQTPCRKPSLLDFGNSKSSKRMKVDQLKDLISFDDGVESLGSNLNVEAKDVGEENADVSVASSSSSKIEKMLQANIMGLSQQAIARRTSTLESLECNVGLAKRK
ncbi:hypothetical protein M9H77_10124 [Catharanthus roseus]|uniref:Uncharacterized protein n=1 Tax=Catharanthus roseus TaxID=4058 RepID=A0ACC0C2K1_CATRO|nr:hypothetical protein M9H77_10124 [Catharanthus roseus]